MNTILDTDRLLLRELVEDDAPAVLAFNGDPEVMRYTHEPPWTDLEETRRRLREYPDYREHGFGRWALVHKADGEVIGFCGLKHVEWLDEVDLGYRLAHRWWGQGLATEAARAVLRHGFQKLGLERIIALVLPGNRASIRVLEKLGMARDGTVHYEGVEALRWAASAESWLDEGGEA